MRDEPSGVRSQAAGVMAKPPAANTNGSSTNVENFTRKVQALMWQYVGVVRDGKGLRQVVTELKGMEEHVPPPSGGRPALEAANIVQTGLLIARSALAREESRGAHYRIDYPLKNETKFHKHSVVIGEKIRFE
jgi:L-aspartate oxidase